MDDRSLEEELRKGFICINCKKWVPVDKQRKTLDRNHCPYCLWSKHVDQRIAGDRMSVCNHGMKPIALTFKKSRVNKWGQEVTGEVMIVHQCMMCEKININMILAEDDPTKIIEVFEIGKNIDSEKKEKLNKLDIKILTEENREELEKQIFGKSPD